MTNIIGGMNFVHNSFMRRILYFSHFLQLQNLSKLRTVQKAFWFDAKKKKCSKSSKILLYETVDVNSSRTTEAILIILFYSFLNLGRVHFCSLGSQA